MNFLSVSSLCFIFCVILTNWLNHMVKLFGKIYCNVKN
jgi:hypothetical protein